MVELVRTRWLKTREELDQGAETAMPYPQSLMILWISLKLVAPSQLAVSF